MADDLTSFLSPVQRNDTAQTSRQFQSLNSLTENFDNFLTILTTQLQNQDPLSPLDTHEFTNQLVMFADVEQSVRQSGQLDNLISIGQQNEASAAVAYIGSIIQSDSNSVNFTGETVGLTYNLSKEADQAALEIYDVSGELVSILTGVGKTVGEHQITWDGTDQNGNSLPNGTYKLQVAARNNDEELIDVTYKTSGTVTGVDFNNGDTTLLLGDVQIPLARVLRVEDTVND